MIILKGVKILELVTQPDLETEEVLDAKALGF